MLMFMYNRVGCKDMLVKPSIPYNDLPSMRLSEAKAKILTAVRASVKVSTSKVQDLKNFLVCLKRTKQPTLNALASEMRLCPSEPTVVEYTCTC